MKYDLVFEGGGAKGIALVGAYEEFSKQGHTFGRLLGTSAGAITAAFLAAGYTVDEFQAALTERDANGKPVFASFMGEPPPFTNDAVQHGAFRKLLAGVDLTFIPNVVEDKVKDQIAAAMANNARTRNFFALVERGGWYSADNFLTWLRAKMNAGKVNGKQRNFGGMTLLQFHTATGVDVTFCATDTKARRQLVLNHRTAPQCPLVSAVRMSMSIPLLWDEVIWQKEWGAYQRSNIVGDTIVDGGVLSNFPLELFVSDAPFVTAVMGPKQNNPVLGLLLDDDTTRANPARAARQSDHRSQRACHRQAAARAGGNDAGARDKQVMEAFADLVVALPAGGYGVTEFDMSDARRNALVEVGAQCHARLPGCTSCGRRPRPGPGHRAAGNEYRQRPGQSSAHAAGRVIREETMTYQTNQTVQAQTIVNVRRSPGHVAKPDGDLMGQLATGAAATILGAASQVDGLTWWPIRCTLTSGAAVDGWCADAIDGQPLLATPSAPVPGSSAEFAAGEQVTIVAPYPVNVRASAGYAGKPPEDVVATVFSNAEFTVQGGPVVADALTWWQIAGAQADGAPVAGWVAEAGPDGNRFLALTRLRSAIVVGKPFDGVGAVTQWWGSNPDFYSQFNYDGVPLRGHNGIDFGVTAGTPLRAVDAGRVKRSDFEEGGFGNFVLLEHTWGESLYAHMTERTVAEGDTVQAGQFIGPSGNSGAGTGPHLHFGIRIQPYRRTDGWGGFCDPKPFMDPAYLVQSRARTAPTPMAPETPDMQRP